MSVIATWDGIEIDPDLLAARGYREPIEVRGTEMPRLIGYMQAGIYEMDTAVLTAGSRLTTVSTSSVAIGTGSKNFTVETGRGFAPGMLIYAEATGVVDQYMVGRVVSYDGDTGALQLDVLDTAGSGTYSAWVLSLSGRGKQGIQGPMGPPGAGSTILAEKDGVSVTDTPRPTINLLHSLTAAEDGGGDRINIGLEGDEATPDPNSAYGTDGNGDRGWISLAGFAKLGANNFTGTQNLQDNELQRPTIRDYALTKVAKGSVSGAQSIDMEAGNYFTATAMGAITWTFSNPPANTAAGGFILALTNGGNFVQTWPASVRWSGGEAPELTADGTDVLVFVTDDEGATWRGTRAMEDV